MRYGPSFPAGVCKDTWEHLEKEPGTPACWDNTYSDFSAFPGREVAHSNIQYDSPVNRNKESLLTTMWVPQDFHIYIFLSKLESYALGKTSLELKWSKS